MQSSAAGRRKHEPAGPGFHSFFNEKALRRKRQSTQTCGSQDRSRFSAIHRYMHKFQIDQFTDKNQKPALNSSMQQRPAARRHTSDFGRARIHNQRVADTVHGLNRCESSVKRGAFGAECVERAYSITDVRGSTAVTECVLIRLRERDWRAALANGIPYESRVDASVASRVNAVRSTRHERAVNREALFHPFFRGVCVHATVAQQLQQTFAQNKPRNGSPNFTLACNSATVATIAAVMIPPTRRQHYDTFLELQHE
jgi:hypothetical protein